MSENKKSQYRANIYNFLTSDQADRYRYKNYANIIIKNILN